MKNQVFTYAAFGDPLHQLRREITDLPTLAPSRMRVRMIAVPVNPSDLIPVTGAYAHRITLPAIVGYDGVGEVIAAPEAYSTLIGKRVLPLRGAGTWQAYVDCDPELAVPIPEHIGDLVACRAYINPMAALLMLDRWSAAGKRVLLSGAGSMCAELLGRWASKSGAAKVEGIYRSEARIPSLIAAGIDPVSIHDLDGVIASAGNADLTFDALGGTIGSTVLEHMPNGSSFIGYGLLSGQSISAFGAGAAYHRFHLRDSLAAMTVDMWQAQFRRLWPMLNEVPLSPVAIFPSDRWEEALQHSASSGGPKVVLSFQLNCD